MIDCSNRTVHNVKLVRVLRRAANYFYGEYNNDKGKTNDKRVIHILIIELAAAFSYLKVRGLYFLAVIFTATIHNSLTRLT